MTADVTSARRRAWLLLRDHRALVGLLAAGLVLRAVVTWTYAPAFWFPDSRDYLAAAELDAPLVHRPYGYSAFLDLLQGLVPFRGVAVVQHLLGTAAAAVVYAALVHRGVRRRWAWLAALPLVVDGYALVLEHYVLAESLFTFQVAVAVALLVWRDRPGWVLTSAAGLVLGAAAVTRTVGLFVVAVVALVLVVRALTRDLRWTSVAAFAVAGGAVVLAYCTWFWSIHGVFNTNAYSGYFAYGRATVYVECDEIEVPRRLQGLCPTEPVGERPHPDFYYWDPRSPAYDGRWSQDDLAEFGRLAIRQQPWDYARTTLRTIGKFAEPTRRIGPTDVCAEYWHFPTEIDRRGDCTADLADQGFALEPVRQQLRPGPAQALAGYQAVVHVHGPILAALFLGTVGAALRPRLPVGRRLEALGLAGVALTLVAVPAATALYDYRYGIPLLAVLPPALALALRAPTPAPDPPVEPDSTPAARQDVP